MTSSTSSGFRRSLATLIATGAATVTAGFALATAGTASAEEAAPSQTYPIKPLDSISVTVKCPANAPYLVSHDYAPARHVPKGVEVIEEGWIGVTMSPTSGITAPATGKVGNEYMGQWATGASGTATNWDTRQRDVILVPHCTSDKDAGWPLN